MYHFRRPYAHIHTILKYTSKTKQDEKNQNHLYVPVRPPRFIMKTINVEGYVVVKAGMECCTGAPVAVQSLVAQMERNKDYIYWLQRARGGVETQIACLKINGVFHGLNMKLEKAIFRHVRLTRDFVNLELLSDGTQKLRIPTRLLHEKLRTSCRFRVRGVCRVCSVLRFVMCAASAI